MSSEDSIASSTFAPASTSGPVRVSTLSLVDLAGSESVRNTGSTGMSLSTGQYTAPADGLYHFSCTMTWDGGDAGDDSFGIGFIISNNSSVNISCSLNNNMILGSVRGSSS